MQPLADLAAEAGWRRARPYVLALLTCTLSVTSQLKVLQIQYLELILAVDFLLLSLLFLQNGARVRIFKPFLSIGKSYVIFMAAALVLSFFSLDQTFATANFTVLKRPILVTVARIVELSLDVFYALYLASLYREDEALCRFAARVYYWVGVAGGLFALATFPLNYFYQINLGTYLVSHRLRGFNNEGGSYGTYLVTVCLLTMAMHHRKWLTRRQFRWGMVLFVVCLFGSQSKGAFFVVALAAVLQMVWTYTGWRRSAVVVGVCAFFVVLALVIDLPGQIDVYVQGAAQYQRLSKIRSEDGNYVMGRVSGAVLAPRMIAARPLLGIGWGNYPMVRDDPAYRQGTAFSLGDLDSPSLGPIDYIVELGFPLWIYMTWISIKPVYLLRRRRADPLLLNLAMLQPLSVWFGAHLNIAYPWVVLGLALGMGFPLLPENPPLKEAA